MVKSRSSRRQEALIFFLLLCAFAAQAAFRGDGTAVRAYGYPTSTNLNCTNDITIACWIIKEAGFANASEFLNKGRNDNGNKANYAFRDDSAGGLELYWANPDAGFHGIKSVTKCARTNTPIHIAVTHQFSGTNNSMFWIDGSRANVQASFGTPQSNGAITNASALTIMGYTGGQMMKGQILEVAIFSTRLTAEEIATLAKGSMMDQVQNKGPLRQYLMGYWKFTEVPSWQTVTGQAWNDYSGWNCHLTATNSPASRPTILSQP